jgi:N-acetylglucosamine malate deacetylase 1
VSHKTVGGTSYLPDCGLEPKPIADDLNCQFTAQSPIRDIDRVVQRRALAIFAHPDDAELACFGSLASLATRGYQAHIVALSDGSNSTSKASQLRPVEAKEAAELIKADLTIEHFTDGALTPNAELHACISAHLKRVEPAILFTHCPNVDYHQDHEVTGRIVTAAAMRFTAIRLVLQAEPPIFVGSFAPNLYADITASIAMKLEAVQRYKSEADKWYMTDESILQRAAWWARQAEPTSPQGPRFFEAFRVAKALFTDFGS